MPITFSGPTLVNGSFALIDNIVTSNPGQIVRVFNNNTTTQTYTYTSPNDSIQSVNISSGSVTYVLENETTAADSYNATSKLIATKLGISDTVLGTTFTEEILLPGSGNWTKPTGVTQVVVECWGGGGAGGGVGTNNSGGGGGAGAQYARKFLTYSSAQQSIPYSVASLVTGTTGNGVSGSDSTWNTSDVVAKGGAGGLASNALNAGVGGAIGSINGGIGDVIRAGGDGGNPTSVTSGPNTFYYGGGGGGAAGSTQNGDSGFDIGGTPGQENPVLGSGANGGFFINSGNATGEPGNAAGGGGSGAVKTTGGGSIVGGNGSNGRIRVIYR